TLGPVADSTIDCSTTSALGIEAGFRVGPKHAAVLRFDVPAALLANARTAQLDLTALRTYAPGAIAVFALAEPVDPVESRAQEGIATGSSDDRGLEDSSDVVLVERFESDHWFSDWSRLDWRSKVQLTTDDEGHGFLPLHGRALRVSLRKGANLALDLRRRLAQEGTEPTEVYLRYYLRLGDDWGSDIDGGKLPGLSGTYGRAGWGGRDPDGHNGWNMRMTF